MKLELKSAVTEIEIDNNLVTPRIVAPYHSGEFVVVRPVKGNEEQKTYFGIMLGDMNIAVGHRQDESGITLSGLLGNPAIFVPELKQLVYGVESWWKIISSPEHLEKISDEDLQKWGDRLKEQIAVWQAKVAEIRAKD